MTEARTTGARPRIGIDARYLSHGLVGGVHTYVHHLTTALLRVAPDRDWIVYADAKAPFELTDLPPSVTLRTLPWRGGASSVCNDLRIGGIMAREGVRVAHFPANCGFAPAGLPAVITLHDAINLLPLVEIWRTHPKQPRMVLTMTYLHLLTTRAMRRRPFVLTVSDYSRREILRHTDLPADRVHAVHSAHDADFRLLDSAATREARERLWLRPRVLLADAIKNPACVLRAYRALPTATRERTSLVFFARRPPAEMVQRAADSGECVLLHRPPREELIVLYNLADLFIFPSWYEGFGLPALEAMACGAPVIASDRGSLPEVVGEGGLTIDAEDHEAIAAAVADLFAHEEGYARLRERALIRASAFSWEQTARRTLAVYDEAQRRWAPRQADAARRAISLGGGS